MSLDYNWRECSPEAKGYLDLNFHPNVWNLSAACLSARISQITEDNVDKFWNRYCAMQHALGLPTYASQELIKLCVGFSTNVSEMTDAEFKKWLGEAMLQNGQRLVMHHNTDPIKL